VCPSSFIDRRRVRRIPQALHRSKALKHGHCRVRTSSIGADRGDNEIWIYGLAGSFIIVNNSQIISGQLHRRQPRPAAGFFLADKRRVIRRGVRFFLARLNLHLKIPAAAAGGMSSTSIQKIYESRLDLLRVNDYDKLDAKINSPISSSIWATSNRHDRSRPSCARYQQAARFCSRQS
jgi:hypothetical protein